MTAQDKSTLANPFSMEDLFGKTRMEDLLNHTVHKAGLDKQTERAHSYANEVRGALHTHSSALKESSAEMLKKQTEVFSGLAKDFAKDPKASDLSDYLSDFAQRSVLFLDIMRQRGNQFVEHERAGCPPVLAYDFEVLIDGATLERPVNYTLVRIHPPAGVTVNDDTRPYIIIDPRAGHGSGIGGFKSESEVGVALDAGHPVYFCIFKTHPEPGQTIADVTRAEAGFVREVRRRHPQSPKPVVIGNCQGGWAAMLLAATNPDLTGPVVLNGAPLSYWSGTRGKHPMRYYGGIYGGVAPIMMMADLGNGQFDGANLVENFEKLNPGGNYIKKYYDVFANPEDESARYLDFENWWSGFYFMNESEIRWIVENLFIGNMLARGGAQLDSRLHADLRNVRAPVIVFASHGDNITPPPQALNWIADVYSSVQEIKALGQKIVYTVHDSVGHLGIFVSASVAVKEHKEIVSTLEVIEAMAPGLYEMVIVNETGSGRDKRYEVSFEERSIDDILAMEDGRDDEKPFAAVNRISQINAELYSLTLRPLVRAMTTPATAKHRVDTHPLRLRRYLFSDKNPLLSQLAPAAEKVRVERNKVDPSNPYLQMEGALVRAMHESVNLYRDMRDGVVETMFNMVYASPLMRAIGATEAGRISEAPATDLRTYADVNRALEQIDQGGYADAVIRMLILLAHARKGVRRDRLERSNTVLSERQPFADLGVATRNRIIHQQSLTVEFETAQALATLPRLLPAAVDRVRAIETCEFVLGEAQDMNDDTRLMFDNIRAVLGRVADSAPAKPKAAPRAKALVQAKA
jgi:pimeloyl-ACP methyl ester carboxylesterase